jgi:aminoglycoside/choline kinase family phosphotransferase
LEHNQDRIETMKSWLAAELGSEAFEFTPASSDAGFRRYFRVNFNQETRIIMDAPPDKEDCRPFIAVAALHRTANIHVPEIYAADLKQGFLLLSDLGSTTYLQALNNENANELFRDAVDSLIRWQLASKPGVLPPYDDALLRRELALFPDWYIKRHLGIDLSEKQKKVLESTFNLIVQNNLAQPSVYVHRDFMPRNLMFSIPNPGVLDFQDAVYGPITYDVASLFKDAFISWEEEQVLDWTVRYWEKAKKAGLPVSLDFGAFYQNVEWMGLQRHLKVLGIFARLNYRDGKPSYLEDTPRFINYVRQAASRYDALTPLLRLLDELENKTAQVGYTF